MIFAGLKALAAKTSTSSLYSMMSIFSPQFADDGLHAHALHADTGAHAIDVRILGEDRHFGALAGLARDGLDHHRAVVDLRNFHFEELLHQHSVGP